MMRIGEVPPLTTMLPKDVPALTPVVTAVTVTVADAPAASVPFAGLILSQGVLLSAFQFATAPPVFVITNVRGRTACPATPTKPITEGPAESVVVAAGGGGGAATTVRA